MEDKKMKAILYLMKQKKNNKKLIENLPKETSDKEYLEQAIKNRQAENEIIDFILGFIACEM